MITLIVRSILLFNPLRFFVPIAMLSFLCAIIVLIVSLLLQIIVLLLAVGGSKELIFEKKGYWVRVGSSLLHLGLILFVLDLIFYRYRNLHLVMFWITTGASLVGMVFCFYAESLSNLVKKRIKPPSTEDNITVE